MRRRNITTSVVMLIAVGLLGWASGAAAAAVRVEGQVQAGGGPVAQSTVTLWAGSANAPTLLGQATTGVDGRFVVSTDQTPGADSSLYLVAVGGEPSVGKGRGSNPAIAFLAVLGATAPANVTVNEMTTIASVWTNAQFLEGSAIRGHALGLRIAAGNVPNFVDLATGGWGEAIQGPLNSGQTPTMANFATLADALAGCATRVVEDACVQAVRSRHTAQRRRADRHVDWRPRRSRAIPGTNPGGCLPCSTSSIRFPRSRMDGQPKPPNMRPVPFMPYLIWAPSAWVLPLKFDGGGYRAGGKAMFDSEGNLWVGDNFTIGWQGQDALWQGNATKFAPNGKPLSPITTGFTGGGMEGGTFGAAVDAHDNAWFTTYGGHSIAVFDKNGKPLTPPEGITFGGRLGLMQGIIVTPSGDVWALGASKSQLIYFPKGDLTKGRIVCEGATEEPCKSFLGPFHLAIDQQDRIWVANAFAEHVTRFPAADPSKAENFYSGASPSRTERRQQRECLDHHPVRQRADGQAPSGGHGCPCEIRRCRAGHGLHDNDHVHAARRNRPQRQRHAAAAGRHALSRLALHGRRPARAVGGGCGRQRQRLDLKLRHAEQPDRAVVRRSHRDLSAWHEHRRSDFSARRLCRRWPADADRHRD